MSLKLYYHPLSSFSHKVLIALYEKDIPFEPEIVDFSNEKSAAALRALWPVAKIPVLRDDARDLTIPETSIINEYLDSTHPGKVPLLPSEPRRAHEVRLWDRIFDLHVNAPMGKIVTDRLRPAGMHDTYGIEEARKLLDTALRMIDKQMAQRTWAAGEEFSMADCAAAPALFYANLVMPFTNTYGNAAAYLRRLTERPSFARVLGEAQPYMELIPK